MNQLVLANLALFVAMISVQSGAALAHQLFPSMGAAGTACARVSIAAIMLWIVWRPWRLPISKSAFIAVAGYGLALGFMNLMFYGSLTRIPLGIAVALEFVGPLTMTLFSSRRWTHLLWTALAALGLFILVPAAVTSTPLDPIGAGLALGAGCAWAAYILIGSRVGRLLPTGQASALGMAFAALAVLPFGVTLNGSSMIQSKLWPIAILVAFMSSALPYTLEMVALRRLSPRTFGILMSLEPAFGTLAGAIMLQQFLSIKQMLGVACISMASIGSTATDSAGKVTTKVKNDLN